MGQDPIELIPNFAKRRNFINKMLSFSERLLPKEAAVLKRHRYQLSYILSLYEIIEATGRRTNFEYFRKGFIEGEEGQVEKIDKDLKREIAGFTLNFHPVEEFYDTSRVEAEERAKKMKVYRERVHDLAMNQGFSATKGQTQDTRPDFMVSQFSKLGPPAFNPSTGGSPAKFDNRPLNLMESVYQPPPIVTSNKPRIDYSSMARPNNTTVSETGTAIDAVDRENANIYAMDPSASVNFSFIQLKPYGREQKDLVTREKKLRLTDFDKLY